MNRIIIRYISRFLLESVLLFVVLLLAISGARAFIVGHTIRSVTQRRAVAPERILLAAHWSHAYPALRAEIMPWLPPEGATAGPRPQTIGAGFLRIPDQITNGILEKTRDVWADSFAGGPYRASSAPASVPRPFQPNRTRDRAAPADNDSHHAPQPLSRTRDETQQTARQQQPPTTTTEPAGNHNSHWAVVLSPDASYYNAQGKRMGAIPAGSVMDVVAIRASSSGSLLEGTAHTPEGRRDNIFVRTTDARLFQGKSLHQTSRQEREYESNRATLSAAIARRRKELESGQHDGNPYQTEYRDLLRSYQAYQNQSKQLQEDYDQLTGQERIEAGARLREIRVEAAAMVPRIRQLQQQRDEWNHRQGPLPTPENDPQSARLRQQLQALENQRR